MNLWDNIDENVFITAKERLLRAIKGWKKESMPGQSESLLVFLMQQGAWLPQDRVTAASSLTLEDLRNRIKELLKALRIISTYMEILMWRS